MAPITRKCPPPEYAMLPIIICGKPFVKMINPICAVAKTGEASSNQGVGESFWRLRKTPTSKHVATETIEQLIKQTQTRYIALSYSSGGKSTARELNDILNSYDGQLKHWKLIARETLCLNWPGPISGWQKPIPPTGNFFFFDWKIFLRKPNAMPETMSEKWWRQQTFWFP